MRCCVHVVVCMAFGTHTWKILIACRNSHFELKQEDFLSFSQNTFVYCILYVLQNHYNYLVEFLAMKSFTKVLTDAKNTDNRC